MEGEEPDDFEVMIIPVEVFEYIAETEFPWLLVLPYVLLGLAAIAAAGCLMITYSDLVPYLQIKLAEWRLGEAGVEGYVVLSAARHEFLLFMSLVLLLTWSAYTISIRIPKFSEFVAVRTMIEFLDLPFGKSVIAGLDRRIEYKNVSQYLRDMNIGFRRFYLKGAALLLGVTVVLAVFDYACFWRMDKESIAYSPYFSLDVRARPLEEVDHIEVGCFVREDRLFKRYDLVYPDGTRFDLFEGEHMKAPVKDLWALYMKMAVLDRPSIPAKTGAILPWLRGYGYAPSCDDALRRRYGIDRSAVYIALLRPRH